MIKEFYCGITHWLSHQNVCCLSWELIKTQYKQPNYYTAANPETQMITDIPPTQHVRATLHQDRCSLSQWPEWGLYLVRLHEQPPRRYVSHSEMFRHRWHPDTVCTGAEQPIMFPTLYRVQPNKSNNLENDSAVFYLRKKKHLNNTLPDINSQFVVLHYQAWNCHFLSIITTYKAWFKMEWNVFQ